MEKGDNDEGVILLDEKSEVGVKFMFKDFEYCKSFDDFYMGDGFIMVFQVKLVKKLIRLVLEQSLVEVVYEDMFEVLDVEDEVYIRDVYFIF